MKYSELEKRIKSKLVHWYENGSCHPIWINEETGEKFPMSYHRNQEVKSGTLSSILKSAATSKK